MAADTHTHVGSKDNSKRKMDVHNRKHYHRINFKNKNKFYKKLTCLIWAETLTQETQLWKSTQEPFMYIKIPHWTVNKTSRTEKQG